MKDAELESLLRAEVVRHAGLAETADASGIARSLHALKGAAGLAGEPELARELAALEAAIREGAAEAVSLARDHLRQLPEKLDARAAHPERLWPIPPDGMSAREIDPDMNAVYTDEVRSRLLGIDELLDASEETGDAFRTLFRHVHSIKGAAGAVRDEPMAWFCHGLEEVLEQAERAGDLHLGFREARKHRRSLHGLLWDPVMALALLRGESGDSARISVTSFAPTLRIATEMVDAFVAKLAPLQGLGARTRLEVQRVTELLPQLREMHVALNEALRIIGPPKPWGTPLAAIRRVERAEEQLLTTLATLRAVVGDLSDLGGDVGQTSRELFELSSSMWRTRVSDLFRRVEEALATLGAREGVEVVVHCQGGDEPIERRTLEELSVSMVQLARNAVAHGTHLDAAGRRRLEVHLSARRSANRLVVELSDCGRGVDFARLAEAARSRGLLAAEAVMETQALLSLLFVPGFSTASAPNELAGRGLGLDVVAQTVRRLGGTIRVDSKKGAGFQVTLDIPEHSGFMAVVWVGVGARSFAFFASDVLRVETAAPGVPTLADSIGGLDAKGAKLTVVVRSFDDRRVAFAVDAVQTPEDALVRPLGPLAASLGPFSHAATRANGELRLVVDVTALLQRACYEVPE